MHRDFNHHLGEKYHIDDSSEPSMPGGTDAKRRCSVFDKEKGHQAQQAGIHSNVSWFIPYAHLECALVGWIWL
jgi:hypothetical protein